MSTPVLIAFAGLPGVGKTSVARHVARALPASYLRIDAIEAGLAASTLAIAPAEDAGYEAGYRLAAEALALGQNVVADCVNPIPETRAAWAAVAGDAGARFLAVELTCAPAVHRARVEARPDGPDWAAVTARRYSAWPEALALDTTETTPKDTAARILAAAGTA